MKFYLHEPDENKRRCYTYKALTYLLSLKHIVVGSVEKDTIVLVSVEDITSIDVIRKTRELFKNNRVIVGGHLSKIACKAMSIYADVVWIGHAFEFAECNSFEEIKSHRSAYWQWKTDKTVASTKIDFTKIPVMQIDTRRFYFWHGVGCSNKCKFCVTSWTELHQTSPLSLRDIGRIKSKLNGHGTLKLISNEYSTKLGDEQVQDMLLTDYIRIPTEHGHKKIRCGLEFATEETRRQYGKPITDEDVKKSIVKAQVLGHDLHLFCIVGINTHEEWEMFIENIPYSDVLRPRLFFKFTNLEYQQKTPLWEKLRGIDFNRYYDKSFTDVFFKMAAYKNKRVRVLPLKYPAHAVWRMLMSNVTNIDEYTEIMRLANCKDMDKMVSVFWEMKPWNNDMSNILTSVNEIRRGLNG